MLSAFHSYERNQTGASGKPRAATVWKSRGLTDRKTRGQGIGKSRGSGFGKNPEIRSVGNQPLLHCKSNQISRALDAEDVQQLGFVILDGAHGNLQVGRNLFHALALRD